MQPELKFEMLMDLAGVDYLHYGRDDWQTDSATRSGFSRARVARSGQPAAAAAERFAVVYHLLSITHNQRVRLSVRMRGHRGAGGRFGHRGVGRAPTGSSARRSTCSASCSAATRTCAASSPTTASSATRSARTFR